MRLHKGKPKAGGKTTHYQSRIDTESNCAGSLPLWLIGSKRASGQPCLVPQIHDRKVSPAIAYRDGIAHRRAADDHFVTVDLCLGPGIFAVFAADRKTS